MTASRLLVVLSSDPDGPVVRHRWRLFADALAEAGLVLEVVPWPKDVKGRRRALHRAETADGVVVSSRLLNVKDTRALRRRAFRLAFDVDDALWRKDSRHGARPSLTRRSRFRALVRAAERVFVGNGYLAAHVGEFGGTTRVLPTVVEVPDEVPPAPPATPPVVLGWIGSRATLPYLEAVGTCLVGLPTRLRVIADAAPEMPAGVEVEYVPWTETGWRDALAGCHVGLAPLPDDPWARGKCGLKVLQTMSVGRPVVASAVGVQEEQVRDGVTGRLAATPAAFRSALEDVVGDAALRAEMGRAGFETVQLAWSVEAWSRRVVEAVEEWMR